jgi:hypothetical protein
MLLINHFSLLEQAIRPMLSFADLPEVGLQSIRIEDIWLETIYVVSLEYNLRKRSSITPYFRLKDVIEPPGSSLVLKNVCPREWWDKEVGILRTPSLHISDHAWVSGVISFRDKTGLVLDVILGGIPGKIDQLRKSSQAFPKPWCRVQRVDDSASNMPNSSDTRLHQVFDAAIYNNITKENPLTAATWIGFLVAKVTFEETEFLGRQGLRYKLKFRKLELISRNHMLLITCLSIHRDYLSIAFLGDQR